MLIGCIAITGLPPLNGFVSEFLIYLAALTGQMRLGTGASAGMLLVIGRRDDFGRTGRHRLYQPVRHRLSWAAAQRSRGHGPAGRNVAGRSDRDSGRRLRGRRRCSPCRSSTILLPIVSQVAHWELGGILQVSGQATQAFGRGDARFDRLGRRLARLGLAAVGTVGRPPGHPVGNLGLRLLGADAPHAVHRLVLRAAGGRLFRPGPADAHPAGAAAGAVSRAGR